MGEWQNPPDKANKRGRKTKEEEVRKALADLGIDPDANPDEPVPETFEGFRDEFLKLLWARRNEMTDTSFTQALNSLARLAEANKSADNDANAQTVLIADVIASNVLLSAERKREVLTSALADLDAEREAILGVLK